MTSPFSPNYRPQIDLTDVRRDKQISSSRSKQRQAALKSDDPHLRQAAAGDMGQLSNRTKKGGK